MRSGPSFSRAWLTVAMLWVVGALNYLDRNMLVTMHASIKAAMPITETQFGLLTSIFLWIYGALSPMGGFLADRLGRSRIIILSLVVWSAVTLLCGFARTYEQLFWLRGLMGISEACYLPAAMALIADFHRSSTRSFAIGVHLTGISVGGALGALGGWMADRYGWHYPFRFFGMIGVAYGIVLVLGLRDAPAAAPAQAEVPTAGLGEAISSLFSRGSLILVFAFYGVAALGNWMSGGWLPTYFLERFHLSQGQSGFFSIGFSRIFTLGGYLVGGLLSDWASRRHDRGRIFVCVFAYLMAVPAALLVPNTGVLGLAVGGVMYGSFFASFVDPNLMPILCTVTDSRHRATAYGFLNLFACVIGGVGIYAAGALRDLHIGLNRILLIPVATLLVAALLVSLIRPASEREGVAA